MIPFGFPKPIANNQKPYFDDAWTKKKLKHKLHKMLFSILDFDLNDEFYTQKKKLNPSNKTPFVGFKTTLKRWIESIVLEGIAT
jgi:hypothetical protein